VLQARVLVAFLSTTAADPNTRFELMLERFRVAWAGPGEKPAGHVANIGTIEVQPNTVSQMLDISFGQARIRTDGTDFRTFEAGLDALERDVAIRTGRCRVSPEHPLDLTHFVLLEGPFRRRQLLRQPAGRGPFQP
jgi:hypothetical protein